MRQPPGVAADDAEDEKVPPRHPRNMYISAVAYNALTLTDGAIRIIVLLFLVQLNFSAISLAIMFSLYELMGLVTNLYGGVLGSRYGMRWLLLSSIALQIAGIVLLAPLQVVFVNIANVNTRDVMAITIYVVFAQGLSGISKDLMKIQGKSVPKLCTEPDNQDRLFRVVSILTGMKNSMKGFGYFFGALLIWGVGWVASLCIQAAILLVFVPLALKYMENDLGVSKEAEYVTLAVFKKGWNVNALSLARFFLFAARDIWFEIPMPFFLRKVLMWQPFYVGMFMGGYIVVYGQLQALTSELFSPKRGFKRVPARIDVVRWAAANSVEVLVLGTGSYFAFQNFLATEDSTAITAVLMVGIFVFAALFAVNSAIHSYLIVRYSNKDKVAMDLGFYYMSNAGGRFVGTLASGWLYTYTEPSTGLAGCLWVSTALLVTAAVAALLLRPDQKKASNAQALIEVNHGERREEVVEQQVVRV
jgi:MFS family permease